MFLQIGSLYKIADIHITCGKSKEQIKFFYYDKHILDLNYWNEIIYKHNGMCLKPNEIMLILKGDTDSCPYWNYYNILYFDTVTNKTNICWIKWDKTWSYKDNICLLQ
jgi:hypothetical protein